ncbi:MAG: MobC family plasmid mobilization relaxosome protein [Desulfovibrionaceae bacterium]
MMRRDKRIEVRLSDEEKRDWEAKASSCGQPLADLLRDAMSRVRPWSPTSRKHERERLLAMAMIGNNLNQIARWANAHKKGAEAARIITVLMSLERALNNYFKG